MPSGSMAEWLSAIGTITGLLFIYLQVRGAKRQAKSTFFLQLDSALQVHKEVHKRLVRNELDYQTLQNDAVIEAELISYVGFFERLGILVQDDMISIQDAANFYGYRIKNIVKQKDINVRLFIGQARYWQGFMRLCKQLELYYRSIGEIDTEFSEAIKDFKIIPRASELDWRYQGKRVIYHDQPEFTFVVRRNQKD